MDTIDILKRHGCIYDPKNKMLWYPDYWYGCGGYSRVKLNLNVHLKRSSKSSKKDLSTKERLMRSILQSKDKEFLERWRSYLNINEYQYLLSKL